MNVFAGWSGKSPVTSDHEPPKSVVNSMWGAPVEYPPTVANALAVSVGCARILVS